MVLSPTYYVFIVCRWDSDSVLEGFASSTLFLSGFLSFFSKVCVVTLLLRKELISHPFFYLFVCMGKDAMSNASFHHFLDFPFPRTAMGTSGSFSILCLQSHHYYLLEISLFWKLRPVLLNPQFFPFSYMLRLTRLVFFGLHLVSSSCCP